MGTHTCLVTELLGPSLYEVIVKFQANFTLRDKINLIYQIAKGIQEMQDVQTIHCDLKPENILFKFSLDNINNYI